MNDSLRKSFSTSTSKTVCWQLSAVSWARIGALVFVTGCFLLIPALAHSKEEAPSKSEKVMKGPKTQQVDFDESAVNGTVRRPDGFLLSKKNDPSLSPLFNAKKNIEERIQKSHFILK
ncbi:MAG: hypothetical protein V4736_12615 [Bdellovibrionota bacterium]